ncbi:hypothetical protein D3C86_1187400 [compost metagenome]
MAQEIAVVDRLEAEVLEVAVAPVIHGRFERGEIRLGERADRRIEQAKDLGLAQIVAEGAIAADLLGHVGRKQACCDARVVGLLGHQHDGRRDGALVQLAGGAPLVQPGDGLLRDLDGVHPPQSFAGPSGRAEDLVELDVFLRAVPLDYLHALILSVV